MKEKRKIIHRPPPFGPRFPQPLHSVLPTSWFLFSPFGFLPKSLRTSARISNQSNTLQCEDANHESILYLVKENKQLVEYAFSCSSTSHMIIFDCTTFLLMISISFGPNSSVPNEIWMEQFVVCFFLLHSHVRNL